MTSSVWLSINPLQSAIVSTSCIITSFQDFPGVNITVTSYDSRLSADPG